MHVHSDSCGRGWLGFTLLEIILVVAIALIIAALAVPLFSRSYQAANLRTAARTVVTAGRYARNMAILQQRQVTLFFNTEAGTIEIVALEGGGSRQLDAFLDARRGFHMQEASFAPEVLRQQELPEQVQIIDFTAPSRDQQLDGIYWVNYFPSGVSDSFAVRLSGPQRRRFVRVEIDHLAGTTTTTYE